jgi:acetolactate synthase-1/2/3 large subunit
MEKGGKNVVHINYKAAQVDEVYFPQLEVVGDISASITRLKDAVGRLETDPGYFNKVRREVNKHLQDGSQDPAFPVIPQRVVADIRKVMPDDGILALDNGMYKIWFARNYMAHLPNTVLLDNALATMGAGLPSGMMAAMLNPTKRVMAICGDGGFMMNSQELETAVRLGLNLVVTVLNDSSFGMIRWKQAQAGFEDWGLEFNNPDFMTYAAAYGVTGHRITNTEKMIEVFESAFNAGGVHLVEVPVDYSQNTKVLIEELQQRTCLI